MKKLAAVFLLILAAHAAVIGYFIYRNRAKPAEQAPPTDLPANPAPAIPPPATDTPGTAATPARQPHQLLGKPYHYQNAVFGDIPGLFGCNLATTGIAVDLDTHQVLWAKNPRRPVPIASMTKMMTALLVFETLDQRPDLNYDTMLPVTPSAMKVGGSQVYLDVRESFTIRDLLKAVMIASANDAAELLAEHLGGGSPAFVQRMNRRAAELRLAGAKFHNAHGLPGATAATDNVATGESMIVLAEHLLTYPDAVKWASTRIDFFRQDSPKPFQLTNHNRLIGVCPGVDGMKTGFIQRSGFCITATCQRNGRRIACAVTGFPSRKERDDFVRRLLDWAYARPTAEFPSGTPSGADPGTTIEDVVPK